VAGDDPGEKMRNGLRLMGLAAVSAGLGGCMGHVPYPVTSNDPNPAPVPGYRVICQSSPAPVISFFDRNYTTNCQQVIPPYSDEVVVRAKG
jgi:hypothetical protein